MLNSTTEVQSIINEILSSIAVSLDIDVAETEVGPLVTGYAAEGRNVICIEPVIFASFAKDRSQKIFILAHEIAHHIHHDFLNSPLQRERWQSEVAADWFAARSVKRLGGQLAPVLEVLEECRSGSQSERPACNLRITTVTQAFRDTFEIAPTPDPLDNKGPQTGELVLPNPADFLPQMNEIKRVQNQIRDSIAHSLAKPVDVVVQAGHFNRVRGATGAVGSYVTEQEVAGFVGYETVRLLRDAGISAELVDADPEIDTRFSTKVFVALHLDASLSPCSTGPSFGYPRSLSSPSAIDPVAQSLAVSFDYKVTDFLRDNFSTSLQNYYMFAEIRATELEALIQIGDLSCRPQEVNMISNAALFSRNLTSAIGFLLK